MPSVVSRSTAAICAVAGVGMGGSTNRKPKQASDTKTSVHTQPADSTIAPSATCTKYNEVNGFSGPPARYSSAVSKSTSRIITDATVHSPTVSPWRVQNAKNTLEAHVVPMTVNMGPSGSCSSRSHSAVSVVRIWPVTATHRSFTSQEKLMRCGENAAMGRGSSAEARPARSSVMG